MANPTNPTLWLTYAWADDDEGDFSYLVQELDTIGVKSIYDKIALVPGRRLWDQIADQIINGQIDGWGYLVTPRSLESEACREELAYALDRALKTKGREFPLLGLLHGVRVEDVPPALKVRLCVSLANPNWKEEIKAGLEGKPPCKVTAPQSRYVFKIHKPYCGDSELIAIEVRPRFREIMYWRFIVPESTHIVNWGHGSSDGMPMASLKTMVVRNGTGKLDGKPMKWFGAGDRLSPSVSAYVVFKERLPEFVAFGISDEDFGPPSPQHIEVLDIG